MSVFDTILANFIPHDCLVCGVEGDLICSSCCQKLPLANVEHRLINLDNLRSATLYEGAAKDLIWKLKSGGAQAAAKVMAHQMSQLTPQTGRYFIVPVPTASSRTRRRGYDQAKLIARNLSHQTGLIYLDCLSRRGQAHQVGASRIERLKQVNGALAVKKSVTGINILLVDDVTTTGATLEVAALALKKAGAKSATGLTFAYAAL